MSPRTRTGGLAAVVTLLLVACGGVSSPSATRSSVPSRATPTSSATTRASASDTEPAAIIPSAEPTGCGWGPASPTPGPDAVVLFFTCTGGFDPQQPSGGWAARRVAVDATLEERMTAAMLGLLAGPTEEERDAGLTSWFSSDTAGMLNDVSIEDGLATIDFADFSRIIPNASTSAGSGMLTSELSTTLYQFAEIGGFVVQFDGSCDAFWQWLQGGCQVITRG